jgi:hypothetical protein
VQGDESSAGLGESTAFGRGTQTSGDHEPTILLSDRAEVEQAGFDRSLAVVPVIFSDKLKRAHDHLSGRGVVVGPIQGEASPHFFEIRDIEGNVIEICAES